jgi:hypothetical protein
MRSSGRDQRALWPINDLPDSAFGQNLHKQQVQTDASRL